MVYGHGKMGRNVTISHCYGQRISPNTKDPPEFVDFSFDYYGNLTNQRATRYARRVFGDNTIIINNVEYETFYVNISIADLIRYGERTN